MKSQVIERKAAAQGGALGPVCRALCCVMQETAALGQSLGLQCGTGHNFPKVTQVYVTKQGSPA